MSNDPAWQYRHPEERTALIDRAAAKMGAPTTAEQQANDLATAAASNASDMGAAHRIAYTVGNGMMSTLQLIGRHTPGPDTSSMDAANQAVAGAIHQQHPIESTVAGFAGNLADPVFVAVGGSLGAVGKAGSAGFQAAIPALRGTRAAGYLASGISGAAGMAGLGALRGGLEPNPGQGRVASALQNAKDEAPTGAAFGVVAHGLGELVGAGVNAYRARQAQPTMPLEGQLPPAAPTMSPVASESAPPIAPPTTPSPAVEAATAPVEAPKATVAAPKAEAAAPAVQTEIVSRSKFFEDYTAANPTAQYAEIQAAWNQQRTAPTPEATNAQATIPAPPQPQVAPAPPEAVAGGVSEAVKPNEAPAPEAPARGTPPPQRTASPAEAPPPASASPSGRGVSYKLVDKSGKVLSEHATAGDAVDAKQQAPAGSRILKPGEGDSLGPGAASPADANFQKIGGVEVKPTLHERATRFMDEVRVFADRLRGKTLPRMSQNPELDVAAHRLAASDEAVGRIARDRAGQVLGDRFNDQPYREQFGAALVEDRLRAKRDAFIQAGEVEKAAAVKSIIGQDESPFQNEKQYQKFLADNKDVFERHKQIVQPEVQSLFGSAAPGTALDAPGQQTGAFLSLNRLQNAEGGGPRTGAGKLLNSLKRKPGSARRATGAGEYQYDYLRNVDNAYRTNYSIAKQNQFYDALVKSGDGVLVRAGEPVPPTVKGESAVQIPIQRKTLVVSNDGESTAMSQNETIYVRKSRATEVKKILNTETPLEQNWLAKAVNKIQVATGTDAIFHTGNVVYGITSAEGGGTVMRRLRRLPGVNVADTLVRLSKAGFDVIRDTPEVRSQLAELATEGALRAEHVGTGPGGKFLSFIDKAGRITMDRLFDTLVEGGVAKDTIANRRNYANQLGVYNRRIANISRMTQFLKDYGLSPFVTAGKAFNRVGARAVTGNPGFEATSSATAAQVRIERIASNLLATAAVAAGVNYMLGGNINGRPGVPIGAIDTGKSDEKGNPRYIDLFKMNSVRRGLRVTGLGAIAKGIQQGSSIGDMTNNARGDIAGSFLHPLTGPPIRAGFTAVTGHTADVQLRDATEPVAPGQSNLVPRIKAASREAIPGAEEAMKGYAEGGSIGAAKEFAKSLPATAMSAFNGPSGKAPNPDAIHGAQANDYRDKLFKEARDQHPDSFGDRFQYVLKRVQQDVAAGNLTARDQKRILEGPDGAKSKLKYDHRYQAPKPTAPAAK